MKYYLFSLLLILSSYIAFAQGTETFTNIPATSSSYSTRTWTGDNYSLNWTATDARTDQTLNGRAITVRNGSISVNSVPNGIASLTLTSQQAFTGSNPSLSVFVNSVLVGTITPTTTVAKTTISNINVGGNFNLEIRQTTSGLRVIVDDVTWTSFAATSCSEPTAQPTNLSLSATPTSVSGTFSLIPTPTNVVNYLVVRSTTTPLTALPVDGTTYAAGAQVNGGNGVAVTVSDDGTFTDNNLSPSTLYYYFIFSIEDQNCSPLNYNQVSPLTGSQMTPAIPLCVQPASAPTALTLTALNTSISGSFTGVGDANRYLVVRSLSSTLSTSPANGTLYNSGDAFGGGTVVSYTSATTFNASGLTPATPYYFFVFAANSQCTGEPFYNTTALTGTTTTTNNSTGIPPGYYDAAAGLNCQPLKTALRNIVSTGYNQLTYTPGVWDAYQFTDIHSNDAGTANIIWDMYSDNPSGPEPYTFTYGSDQCGNYTAEGQCYNREHSTPQSFFVGGTYPMYSDLNHLFPTDGKVNALRSNYPYGEVTTITPVSGYNNPSLNGSKLGTGTNFGYSGTVFEPIDAYKGDFARAGLYMATRYENEIIANNWAANGNANALFLSTTDEPNAAQRKLQIYDAWQLQTLFKWHNQDPVSQKEIDRNNAIYYQSGQNNRNPFIDHPEYVAAIFQCTGALPVTLLDFTAQKNDVSVLLKWVATYETNFKNYEIERSVNGVDFIKIATVAGRNYTNYNYTDRDNITASVIYYRLKMVDIDGKSSYSKVVNIKNNTNANGLVVYPNPAVNMITVKFEKTLATASLLRITDVTGRTIEQVQVARNTNSLQVNTSKLPSGRYFIQITNNSEVINQSFSVTR